MIKAEDTIVGTVDEKEQRMLVSEIEEYVSMHSLERPSAGGLEMSVKVSNAGTHGWWADDEGYRYTDRHPVTMKPWGAINDHWKEIFKRFGGRGEPDCAHIVWYESDAKLGWHRDKTEKDLRGGVVTVSLGDDAVWSVRQDE